MVFDLIRRMVYGDSDITPAMSIDTKLALIREIAYLLGKAYYIEIYIRYDVLYGTHEKRMAECQLHAVQLWENAKHVQELQLSTFIENYTRGAMDAKPYITGPYPLSGN